MVAELANEQASPKAEADEKVGNVDYDYKDHLIYRSEMAGGKFMVREAATKGNIGALVGRGFSTMEEAKAAVDEKIGAVGAAQKPDISYRNSADGLFTSFFPNTPEGEKAWNIINATPGAEGGKVLAAHAESTITQLRDAGYTVAEDASTPTVADDDALLAELAESPDAFAIGSVKFQAFAVKIRQGKQRVWGIRVLENGKEMNPADGNGSGFKSDTKASMIEDMERSYAAITKIGDKAKNENRWRESVRASWSDHPASRQSSRRRQK
jgi:hypothetical protein